MSFSCLSSFVFSLYFLHSFIPSCSSLHSYYFSSTFSISCFLTSLFFFPFFLKFPYITHPYYHYHHMFYIYSPYLFSLFILLIYFPFPHSCISHFHFFFPFLISPFHRYISHLAQPHVFNLPIPSSPHCKTSHHIYTKLPSIPSLPSHSSTQLVFPLTSTLLSPSIHPPIRHRRPLVRPKTPQSR